MDELLQKYSKIPYLKKSLQLIKHSSKIAFSDVPFDLTLNLYKTIKLGSFHNEIPESKDNLKSCRPLFSQEMEY